MSSVFISHSNKDKDYYVSLLVKLLAYHNIEYWYDSHDINAGDKFPESIQYGLENAGSVIVIVSENSIKSQNVVRELTIFESLREEPLIIPILIGEIEEHSLPYWLRDHQCIDATKNLHNSFEELFRRIGRKFLSENERRETEDRRLEKDKRQQPDRRTSNINRRLRTGFWQEFSKTGRGQFEDVDDWGVAFRMKIPEILFKEAEKYTVKTSDGNILSPAELLMLLQKLPYEVRESLAESRRGSSRPVESIYLIEGIAEYLAKNFIVEPKARRNSSNRRSNPERRRDRIEP